MNAADMALSLSGAQLFLDCVFLALHAVEDEDVKAPIQAVLKGAVARIYAVQIALDEQLGLSAGSEAT